MAGQSKSLLNADSASFLVVLASGAFVLYQLGGVLGAVKRTTYEVYTEVKKELNIMLDEPELPIIMGSATFLSIELMTFLMLQRYTSVQWYKKAVLGGVLWVGLMNALKGPYRAIEKGQEKFIQALKDSWNSWRAKEVADGDAAGLLPDASTRGVNDYTPFTEQEFTDFAKIGWYADNFREFMCLIMIYLFRTNLVINEYIYAVPGGADDEDKVRMSLDCSQIFAFDPTLSDWVMVWDFNNMDFNKAFVSSLTNTAMLPGKRSDEPQKREVPVIYY